MIGSGDLVVGAVMGVVALTLFLASLRRLSFGLIGLALTVPIQTEFAFHAGGHELTWTKLMFGVVLFAWVVRVLLGASRPRIDAIGFGFACYLLTLGVSVWNAQSVGNWAGECYRWAVAFLVYLLALDALTDRQAVLQFVVVLSCAVLAIAGYAGWQFVTGAGPATFTVDGVTRVYGTFGEPNPFAGYLEMTTLLLIGLVLFVAAKGRHWWRGSAMSIPTIVIVLIGAVAGVVALGATQSRGGYIGFAVGFAVIVWLTGGRIRWLGMVFGGICLVLVLLSPFGAKILDRFRAESLSTGPTQVTVANWATQERAAHWRAAIAMAKAHPLVGVGAGNYNANFRESTTIWRFRIPRGHAHNAYLQALAQAGLLGLIAYLGLLAAIAREVVRALRLSPDGFGRALAIGVAGVTVAVMVHNLVDYLHVLSLGIQLSVVWAILKVVAVGEQRGYQTEPTAGFNQ